MIDTFTQNPHADGQSWIIAVIAVSVFIAIGMFVTAVVDWWRAQGERVDRIWSDIDRDIETINLLLDIDAMLRERQRP